MAQRIALFKSTTLEIPGQMTKVAKSSVSKIASEKFGKTKSLKRIIKYNPDKVFTLGEMVIFVNSADIPQEKGVLKRLKIASDEVNERNKNYSSKIVNIDGKDVIVNEVIKEGFNLIRFTTVNPSENYCIRGFIQYPPKDYVKAKAALENIVTGLKYAK
jgi:hypothetical protein